jgi:hypothetical protein
MNKKYTKEDLYNLTYKDYILLISKELNTKGFTKEDGELYEVNTNMEGGFVSDFSVNFILYLTNKNAIDYLIKIGLLNNGRCPLTGLMLLPSTTITYTSERNKTIKFDISKKYYNKRDWGCIISVILIIISIIIGIILGFNYIEYIAIGIGVLIAIKSLMQRFKGIGNYWYTSGLADKIGINTITLYQILKIERSKEVLDSNTAFMHGICKGDLNAYLHHFE